MKKNPSTGTSTIVLEDGKVLLIKRGKEPYKGYWSLPGGGHEYGETLKECAARELVEETGLTADRFEFCKARDRITRDSEGAVIFHYVLVTFRAYGISGKARAMDDAIDIGWFSSNDMKTLKMTPGTFDYIGQILGDEFV